MTTITEIQTTQVYQVFIKATPDAIWDAITNPDFTEKYFYPMHGAIKAIAADFRRNGRLDIAAISFYPDWAAEHPEGFVYLENAGEFRFVARTFPGSSRGRWLTMDAGDLDGDGRLDLVLGAAYVLKGIPPGALGRFQAEFRRIRPVLVLRGRGE